MTQLPYATPPRDSQYDLSAVATFQTAGNFCILGIIVGFVTIFALPQDLKFIAPLIVSLSQLAGARDPSGGQAAKNSTAIIYGIGTVLPSIGLIVLRVVNSEVSKVLKANGYKIGLIRAKGM